MPTSKRIVKKYSRPNKVPYPVKRYVDRAIKSNIENKSIAGTMATWLSISTAWIELNLCNPAQGDTQSNRSGNQIKITSVEIKGVIASGADETALDDPWNVTRVVLGLYTGNDDAPLAGAGATLDTPIQRTWNTAGRLVKKYLDKYIATNITSTEKGEGDGYTAQVKVFKYFKRFKKPILINYGSTGITLPSKRLILSMVSDSGAVPNPGFVAGYYKVNYEDG